ncbi:DUF3598 family protein [Nostoc sp. CENA67]|uniref:DUF3598 family protein n=1 Tax=Amazonocrinis nigriterrae CENA67 TaxID=2794033 RepID=A0A8J7HYD7_9NOST|nr:DUF3598 family protein [Amazonocrinis nigriterrae]MBH8564749.1 DUF3598 family protein [Amazonocrinis nigriterrae CENA67]
MSNIREEMPILARHEGDWVGTYTLIDTQGKILDKYESHLTCQFPENAPYPYYQINRYSWADGKKEEYEFPGIYSEKNLLFDTNRIKGRAWEADDSTVILHFTYKEQPEMSLYEMILLSPCNNYRARTWHWFKNHQLFQRTLIQEERLRS